MRNPSYFFDASPEHALINPDNLHILVDHVKCAAFELPFTTSEAYGRHNCRRCSASWRRAGSSICADHGHGRSAQTGLAVDQRVLPGGCGQPAVDLLGQLRHRGHDARRRRHRRDELHERSIDAAREGHLPRRGRAVSGGEARLRGAQGVRASDRLRLLHRRDHLHEGHGARDVCGGSPDS